MPAMRRPSRKAEKIAFAILGTPANLNRKQTKKFNDRDKKITYQESQLLR